jgi:transcriptional regulator with XRE-family HTH domain
MSDKLKTAREKSKISQLHIAEELGIAVKTYRNFENDPALIPVGLLFKAAQIFEVNACDLIDCSNSATENSIDDIFVPYFEVLKIVCPAAELEQNETEIIADMVKVINEKIVKYLVHNLLKKVTDVPLFEKIKNFIILTDLGATVRVWSIIEQAASNKSEISNKEKLVVAARNGLSLNRWLISQSERDLIAHLVEMWPEDICNYIMINSGAIIEALKHLSPKAEEAITSNTKMLSFARRFSPKKH